MTINSLKNHLPPACGAFKWPAHKSNRNAFAHRSVGHARTCNVIVNVDKKVGQRYPTNICARVTVLKGCWNVRCNGEKIDYLDCASRSMVTRAYTKYSCLQITRPLQIVSRRLPNTTPHLLSLLLSARPTSNASSLTLTIVCKETARKVHCMIS